jgi:hypothetical protein
MLLRVKNVLEIKLCLSTASEGGKLFMIIFEQAEK